MVNIMVPRKPKEHPPPRPIGPMSATTENWWRSTVSHWYDENVLVRGAATGFMLETLRPLPNDYEMVTRHAVNKENIPFGVASSTKRTTAQCVSRFEDKVIFLAELNQVFAPLQLPDSVFAQSTLNQFAALGSDVRRAVRQALQDAIKAGNLPEDCIEKIADVQMHLPISVGDYTDFSTSPHHNRNAGQALLGFASDLPPGYKHMPLGYAGRCSSIMVSGTPVTRPKGQYYEFGKEGLKGPRKQVTYGPVRDLDYELEMAVIVGRPVPYGSTVTASQAKQNVFGFVLLNDWSSRDIQRLEMIPVGPFNSKNSATTLSAWVITPEALAPFRVPLRARQAEIAPPLHDDQAKGLNVSVEANIIQKSQSFAGTKTNASEMDWSFEQLIAHQSSAGCGLRSGDLLGIGTISGPGIGENGCLLEEFVPGRTARRGYIEDGECVQIIGYCGQGVGFGDCSATVLPAADTSTWHSE